MIEIKESDDNVIELFQEVKKFLKLRGYEHGRMKDYDLGKNWKDIKIPTDFGEQALETISLVHGIAEHRKFPNLSITSFKWSLLLQAGIFNGPLLTRVEAPIELEERVDKIGDLLDKNLFNRHKIKYTIPSYRGRTYLEIYYESYGSLKLNKENVEREIYQFVNTLERLIPKIRRILQPPKRKGRIG